MNKQEVRARIEEIGIVPAIRLSSAEDALFAVRAVADSGIPIAEVTMTVPGAIDVIAELARGRSGLIVGAGSITDTETARRCLGAGAMFLTSPGLDLQIVNFALNHNVVVFPGALTPSEIMAAFWREPSELELAGI
jgi:2-dehydro-3-deoxyphosphogluconate aldolase / (4S)-4-hydroxy-2-oxoglutarate aldolase